MTQSELPFQSDAALIAALLAVDPNGLGGVWMKARHGRARDALEAPLKNLPLKPLRVSTTTTLNTLLGGVDLTESFAQGRIVERPGLLAEPRLVWVSGAERSEGAVLSHIAGCLDDRLGHIVVLSDEGGKDDPLPSESLRDRLAFFLFERFDGDASGDVGIAPEAAISAQERLADIQVEDIVISTLTELAESLGIVSVRAVQMAVACTRALASLGGRLEIVERDIQKSAQLVFGHRVAPCPEQEAESTQPAVENPYQESESPNEGVPDLSDLQVGSAETYLPAGLLAGLAVRAKLGNGKGAGATRISRLRGRPLPSRRGALDGRQRLDILATLQAAAPWQRLRSRSQDARIALRPEDFRVKRYKDRSERVLIFMVDASGSAAMARLAEAKGAVELMLSEAYEHRDRVCLGLFRDDSAELLLPPTRSLTRAKRALSTLPAGGATPLAHGLRLGLETAQAAGRSGQLATLILMTDGRGNRALDGRTDRAAAMYDAKMMARAVRAQKVPVVILDTGRRRSGHVEDLAQQLDADVVPLPSLRSSLRQHEPS